MVCVIGSGFAGAATAYFLARLGIHDGVVLEQEAQAGLHASGNNAAMARQFILDPLIQQFAIRGTQFLYAPPQDLADRPLVRAIGSMILFDEASEQQIRRAVADGHRQALTSSVIQRAECEARVPVLADADFAGAVWTPTDGIIDTHAYLTGLLRAAQTAGVQFVPNACVQAIARRNGAFVVQTERGEWECCVIVNAAGAWAALIAECAGVRPRGLQVLRRHLFWSPRKASDAFQKESDSFWGSYPQWPFVWDNTHEFYFRPESGGLLLCACDEEAVAPGTHGVNQSAQEMLAAKLAAYCPRLAGVQITKSWSGLRTFAPDRRFVLGWDAECTGFYWVAGLGGHGVTCAAAVGEHAANEIAACL